MPCAVPAENPRLRRGLPRRSRRDRSMSCAVTDAGTRRASTGWAEGSRRSRCRVSEPGASVAAWQRTGPSAATPPTPTGSRPSGRRPCATSPSPATRTPTAPRSSIQTAAGPRSASCASPRARRPRTACTSTSGSPASRRGTRPSASASCASGSPSSRRRGDQGARGLLRRGVARARRHARPRGQRVLRRLTTARPHHLPRTCTQPPHVLHHSRRGSPSQRPSTAPPRLAREDRGRTAGHPHVPPTHEGTTVISVRALHQGVRLPPRRRRPDLRRRGREGDRIPRPERRGQVDHDAHGPRPRPADLRHRAGRGRRVRRGWPEPLREVGALLDAGADAPRAQRPRPPAGRRPHATASRRRRVDEVIDQVGLGPAAAAAGEGLLARHAPAPRHRDGAARRPRRPAVRRADERPGPRRRPVDPRTWCAGWPTRGARCCCRAT